MTTLNSNFFAELSHALNDRKDSHVSRLILGWHASFILADDGRSGVGFVPDSRLEPHTSRPIHTASLLTSTLKDLAGLYVSPFPQEFAAASAACSVLLPFDDDGGQYLDAVMTCARGDRVAVLGYERDLVPFMRDWGWRSAFFDDRFAGRQDCFPQEEFSRAVRDAEWVWLSPEAIRDRWLLSTQNILREKKGCFLQGPGIPAIPNSFARLGVTHLVVPLGDDGVKIEAHISAGGSAWLCEALRWRVYFSSERLCCQTEDFSLTL